MKADPNSILVRHEPTGFENELEPWPDSVTPRPPEACWTPYLRAERMLERAVQIIMNDRGYDKATVLEWLSESEGLGDHLGISPESAASVREQFPFS
jgi:hypothetical protein